MAGGNLGIDPGVLETVHASDGMDQMVARATQSALWPATLGYWMDKLLTPIFSDPAVANTRWFFTSYVSGRGAVPAIRIGGQPYGILPTTAFSRMTWPRQVTRCRFRHQQLSFFSSFGKSSASLMRTGRHSARRLPLWAKPGDAHQTLLDIMGLHPASVEFYSRYAESMAELYNIINLWVARSGLL